MDKKIADLVPGMPKPASNSAWHAIRHLNRAWKVRHIDPEMAMFRSITGEEEAATALFLSLQRRKYEGADRLRPRDHVHKAAVIPFLVGMNKVLAKWPKPPKFELTFELQGKAERLLIRFTVRHPRTGEESWGYPEPPLNFVLTRQQIILPKPLEDFGSGVAEVAAEVNVKDTTEFLKKRANVRNRLLYAGSQGIPGVAGDVEAGLALYQSNVFSILRAYMLIDPYPARQAFAQQGLFGFLNMLKQLPEGVEF
ncbi:MAG TPA: hypothetical protein VNA69_02405 [Thermoanaerobaculia bacterium]|nr:hypothetical protein [Thermoanaerobaculia bacterium]